jgi:hypothetical protein
MLAAHIVQPAVGFAGGSTLNMTLPNEPLLPAMPYSGAFKHELFVFLGGVLGANV